MECAVCATPLARHLRFCTSCGAAAPPEVPCAACGLLMDRQKSFCPRCGSRQPDESSTTGGTTAEATAPPVASEPAKRSSLLDEPQLTATIPTTDGIHMPGTARRTVWLVGLAFLLLYGGYLAQGWYRTRAVQHAASPLVDAVSVQVVAEQVRLELSRDPATSREPVHVVTEESGLLLEGQCSSEAARALVRKFAEKTVAGRLSLIDNLTVVSQGPAHHKSRTSTR